MQSLNSASLNPDAGLLPLQYDAAGDRLWLEAGTNSGSVGFFPVDGSGALTGGAALAAPAAALSGGHSTVRANDVSKEYVDVLCTFE